MTATLDEKNVGGYSAAYSRDDTYFPVYITAALAAIFVTATWITAISSSSSTQKTRPTT